MATTIKDKKLINIFEQIKSFPAEIEVGNKQYVIIKGNIMQPKTDKQIYKDFSNLANNNVENISEEELKYYNKL